MRWAQVSSEAGTFEPPFYSSRRSLLQRSLVIFFFFFQILMLWLDTGKRLDPYWGRDSTVPSTSHGIHFKNPVIA